jgi:glucose/arabinose dehydrogenase
MYQFKILLSPIITILFNLLLISKLYALGINDLKVEKLQDFEYAWGMDLIDNENLLVSEKKGVLYIYNFSTGKIVGKEAFNDVFSKRQGGLLDIIFVKDKEKKFRFFMLSKFKF